MMNENSHVSMESDPYAFRDSQMKLVADVIAVGISHGYMPSDVQLALVAKMAELNEFPFHFNQADNIRVFNGHFSKAVANRLGNPDNPYFGEETPEAHISTKLESREMDLGFLVKPGREKKTVKVCSTEPVYGEDSSEFYIKPSDNLPETDISTDPSGYQF